VELTDLVTLLNRAARTNSTRPSPRKNLARNEQKPPRSRSFRPQT
jgi:hypothetical protein